MSTSRKPADSGPHVRYLPYSLSRPDLRPPVLTLDELREWRDRLIAPLLEDKPAEG